MAPPVEGILGFVAYRYRIERAIPLGDIEYVDGKNRAVMARGDSKLALVAIGLTDTHLDAVVVDCLDRGHPPAVGQQDDAVGVQQYGR